MITVHQANFHKYLSGLIILVNNGLEAGLIS